MQVFSQNIYLVKIYISCSNSTLIAVSKLEYKIFRQHDHLCHDLSLWKESSLAAKQNHVGIKSVPIWQLLDTVELLISFVKNYQKLTRLYMDLFYLGIYKD